MSSTILLRHLSNSSLVGQSKEFTGGRIRLGRKPDNDVVFNPDLDRAVSGHHCDIVLEGDDLYVEDTGSTNGTFVNGSRVQGRVKVTNRDQITLGDRGPTLAVSLAVPAGFGPNTIVGNVAPASVAPAFTRPGAAPAYSLEAPHPGVTAAPPPMPPSLTNSAANRPTSRASQGAKTSIGMNTLMTELNKVTRRERTRAKMIGIPIIILLAVGLTLAIYFSSGKTTQIVTNNPSTMPASPAEWSRVIEERKHSVYLVVLKTPNMEDRGNGTCWSVAPGVLATNSHVAQEFIDLEEGQSLVARSNANPPVDVRIVSVQQHPGYVEWNRMTSAYVPMDAERHTRMSYPANFDVALMMVDEEDKPKQTKPLELADIAAMKAVTEATELAYVGFPIEQAVGGGVNVKNPTANSFVGTLTRKTDVFLNGGDESQNNLFQYTLVVQGGASGSPVWNRDGKVVGLVSGNDHFFSSEGRISITGKSFGPRADCVRQLLDKTAEATVAPLAPKWRATFKEKWDKANKADCYNVFIPARVATCFKFMTEIRKAGNVNWHSNQYKTLKTWEIEITEAGPNGAKPVTPFPITEAGVYAVTISSDNPDLVPVFHNTTIDDAIKKLPRTLAKKVLTDLGDGTPFIASFPKTLAAGDVLPFTVSGMGKEPGAKATMKVQLIRAVDPTP